MEKGSVAILCGGGPAPGINTVVATITKRFISDGYKVLGLNYGYKTLFTEKPDFIELNFDLADRIFNQGGSYLRMSRHKPKDDEFTADFFKEHNVKLLVTIGGDDTASSANRLTAYLEKNNIKIQNIHVPKTIDNDLPLPYNLPTFGYHTSKNEGVRIASTVYEDGRTSGNWFVVCSMGREAGHLAFGIGASAHYPMIIVPEMFKNVEVTFERMVRMMVSSIVKRIILGIDYGAIIISEGVFHLCRTNR
jgi:ATP-dependent phosphofructokinase / diphosphate-dependent phosphofructokinase